ncbi:hypothetical protein HZZ13_16920 [Bradyrhizobium sp. CNPSo 4010]|uniref:Uncharacterized protein n=1 Tax=Bradyrhizobium agreste TaxID=2751811 RepID=A0ABS0PQG3_9BRAD|nr:hypothetical protein [Bradyrhizobium agreste]MBH5399451.1 hypothetical protein [Bradyrhizobium agreste]
MDFITRLLLGITAFAVLGYTGFVYGGCAADPDCHFASVPAGACSVALITHMCRVGRTGSAPGPTKP